MKRFAQFAEWHSENAGSQSSSRSRLGRVEELTGKDLERASDSSLLTVLEKLGTNKKLHRIPKGMRRDIRSTFKAYIRYRLSR